MISDIPPAETEDAEGIVDEEEGKEETNCQVPGFITNSKNRYIIAITIFTFLTANIILFAIEGPSASTQAIINEENTAKRATIPVTTRTNFESNNDQESESTGEVFDNFNPFPSKIIIHSPPPGTTRKFNINWRKVLRVLRIIFLTICILTFLVLINYSYVYEKLHRAYQGIKELAIDLRENTRGLIEMIVEKIQIVCARIKITLRKLGGLFGRSA
jgi:hypothetical protein